MNGSLNGDTERMQEDKEEQESNTSSLLVNFHPQQDDNLIQQKNSNHLYIEGSKNIGQSQESPIPYEKEEEQELDDVMQVSDFNTEHIK